MLLSKGLRKNKSPSRNQILWYAMHVCIAKLSQIALDRCCRVEDNASTATGVRIFFPAGNTESKSAEKMVRVRNIHTSTLSRMGLTRGRRGRVRILDGGRMDIGRVASAKLATTALRYPGENEAAARMVLVVTLTTGIHLGQEAFPNGNGRNVKSTVTSQHLSLRGYKSSRSAWIRQHLARATCEKDHDSAGGFPFPKLYLARTR